MIATPPRASASAVGPRSSPTMPSAKAWLTATRPCIPAASDRAAICRSSNAPKLPKSCRWMSTPTPRRDATANTASRCPPTKSAPSATAASSRSAVPGAVNMPDCGNATTWMSTASANRSRTSRIACRLASPTCGSTSTWQRIRTVPCATACRTSADARSTVDRPRPRSATFSATIRSATVSPGRCGCQPSPSMVLSRWMWPSTSPAHTSRPFSDTPSRAESAGSIAAISPSATVMSTNRPSSSRPPASTVFKPATTRPGGRRPAGTRDRRTPPPLASPRTSG